MFSYLRRCAKNSFYKTNLFFFIRRRMGIIVLCGYDWAQQKIEEPKSLLKIIVKLSRIIQKKRGLSTTKRYCKDIDISDRKLISRAVYSCLEGKYRRNDVLDLFSAESGLTRNQIYCIFYRYGKDSLKWIVEKIINSIQYELLNKDLHFPAIWYKTKIDPSSFKERKIGIQNIKQQIYDYVAVEGLQPILCRIGANQCASIKGKGCIYGVRKIRRWLRNKSLKYFAKTDIKKCYESIDRKMLMDFLRKKIKNDLLLWLIETLISTFDKGLSIGSYLSQFLCNIYLSQLYHEISHMHRYRKKRKTGEKEYISLVKHQLFYMDDIMLMSTNSKDIHKAVKQLIKYAKDKLGLEIKVDWFVSKIDIKDSDTQFIDMMGYRIYRWHTTIRRRTFKRIRRTFLKVKKLIGTHKAIPILWARRVVSYWGQIINSNSNKINKKYNISKIVKICKKVVSNYGKGTFYGKATACPSYC